MQERNVKLGCDAFLYLGPRRFPSTVPAETSAESAPRRGDPREGGLSESEKLLKAPSPNPFIFLILGNL